MKVAGRNQKNQQSAASNHVGQTVSQARATSAKTPQGSKQTYMVHCKLGSGESDDLGLATLAGAYVEAGTNHERKFYARRNDPLNADTIFLYFWDERDGADFSGWYFGEEVGGSQVWSRCPKADRAPPKTGWCVPWDGEVQENLVVEAQKGAEAKAFAAVDPPGTVGKAMRAMEQTLPGARDTAAAEVIDLEDEEEAEAPGCLAGPGPGPEPSQAKRTSSEQAEQLDKRAREANERVSNVETEATQALESVRAMMMGDLAEDSLTIVQELLESQQASLKEAQEGLAADVLHAKRAAPKTLAALNSLATRLRGVQAGLAQEMKEVKQQVSKKKEERELARKREEAQEMDALAEQRDAKALEESLPEVMALVTAVEEALEGVLAAAAEEGGHVPDAAAHIQEVESKVAKTQEAVRRARAVLNQKRLEAKRFAAEAKKIASAEYDALAEKVGGLQRQLTPHLRFRRDYEQRLEVAKVVGEVTGKLASIEGEMEKLAARLAAEPPEAELKSMESAFSPVAAGIAGAQKIIEQRLQRAEGSSLLKKGLSEVEGRASQSKAKFEELRSSLRGRVEQCQVKAALKQGLEKAEAAEAALGLTEEAEAPFLKGLELEGVEAANAIAKLKEAGRTAEAAILGAKSFLKPRIADFKSLREELRAGAMEELAQLASRVEATVQRLATFKGETAAREASALLLGVSRKLSEAETAVQQAVVAAAPLLEEAGAGALDATGLRLASEQTLEAEKAAALACAEARRALTARQREGPPASMGSESQGWTAELARLSGRLAAVQSELSKQRKVAVQGERLWKGKLLLQEREEQLALVEADLAKAEILARPETENGRLPEDRILETSRLADSAERLLTDITASLEASCQQTQSALKQTLQASLDRCKVLEERVSSLRESTREDRQRHLHEKILQEVHSKLKKLEEVFAQVAEAEAPYLKGMEILPPEEATAALTDSDAAAASAEHTIGDLAAFVASKSTEIQAFDEPLRAAGLEVMDSSGKKISEAQEKLQHFRNDTRERKAMALQQEALASVSEAAEASQKAIDAALELSAEKIDGSSVEAGQEIIANVGSATREAEEKVSKAKNLLRERELDKVLPTATAELSKLSEQLTGAETHLKKAKAAASEHEQRLVARILLQEVKSQWEELELELEKATAESAPLIVEGGKTFVVASITAMIAEALSEHCLDSHTTREDLFKSLCSGGSVPEAEFLAFLEGVPELCSRPDLAFSPEQRAAVFAQANRSHDGSLSLEEFNHLFCQRYCCVQEATLTEGFDVQESQPVGCVKVSDIVEAVTEPRLQEQLGLTRLEVLLHQEGPQASSSGGTRGWVTLHEDQTGVAYFEPFTVFAAFVQGLNKTLTALAAKSQAVQALVTSKTAELRDCKAGPLAEAKVQLLATKTKLNTLRAKTSELTRKVEEGKREHVRREEMEIRKQREKRESKAASRLLEAVSEKLEPVLSETGSLQESASPLALAVGEPELLAALTPLSVSAAVTEAAKKLTAQAAEARECLDRHASKLAANTGKGPWQEARQELEKMRAKLGESEQAAAATLERVELACQSLGRLLLGRAVKALRARMWKCSSEKSHAAEALFQELAEPTEAEAMVTEQRLTGLLRELPGLDFSPEQLELLLRNHGAPGGLGRRGFLAWLERFARCVKDVTITGGLQIRDNPSLRRLEEKEYVEVLDGPETDENAGVQRVHIKALSDGLQGWVTVKGNHGTAYLEDCPRPSFVATEVFALQGDFGSEDSKQIRTVEVGEVIDVMEGPRRETLGNAQRVRGRATSDGVVGWFTACTRSGRSCGRVQGTTFTCRASIALTDALGVKECKVIRKLDRGEELVVFESPAEDPVAGVTRIKAKAKKDDVEGWVTVRGNAGTVYVEETGRIYVLEEELPLQAELASHSPLVRLLSVGETVERLEGPEEEVSNPVLRVRGRAVLDNSEGWFTLTEANARPQRQPSP